MLTILRMLLFNQRVNLMVHLALNSLIVMHTNLKTTKGITWFCLIHTHNCQCSEVHGSLKKNNKSPLLRRVLCKIFVPKSEFFVF